MIDMTQFPSTIAEMIDYLLAERMIDETSNFNDDEIIIAIARDLRDLIQNCNFDFIIHNNSMNDDELATLCDDILINSFNYANMIFAQLIA